MIRKYKLYLCLIFIFVFFISLISYVSAFGISSPYWNTNPLEMRVGESKDISFNLQNCPALSADCVVKDENVVVSLQEGKKIARITSGKFYTIPFGTADQFIIMKVKIPSNAKVGDIYNVRFSVASYEEAGGSINIGVEYIIEFPVVIIA